MNTFNLCDQTNQHFLPIHIHFTQINRYRMNFGSRLTNDFRKRFKIGLSEVWYLVGFRPSQMIHWHTGSEPSVRGFWP